mgnify:CR=1 FL=1
MNIIKLKLTAQQADVICEALCEYSDNEQNFLRSQIRDQPDDLETIIQSGSNINNIQPILDSIYKAKKQTSSKERK